MKQIENDRLVAPGRRGFRRSSNWIGRHKKNGRSVMSSFYSLFSYDFLSALSLHQDSSGSFLTLRPFFLFFFLYGNDVPRARGQVGRPLYWK